MSTPHAYGYRGLSRFMTCFCGAEQDVTTRDGAVVRRYRSAGAETWRENDDPCARDATKDPAPPTTAARAIELDNVTKVYGKPYIEPEKEVIGITPLETIIAKLDLQQGFSPVLPMAGPFVLDEVQLLGWRRFNLPVAVTMLSGGGYALHPTDLDDRPVLVSPLSTYSAAAIKVMRARYVLQRSEWAKSFRLLPPEDVLYVGRLFDLV